MDLQGLTPEEIEVAKLAGQVYVRFKQLPQAHPADLGEVVRAGAGSFYAAQPGGRHGVVHEGGRIVLLNMHGPDAGFAESIRRL